MPFEKWHGCHNDFIVCTLKAQQKDLLIPSLQRSAAKLCSRKGSGIGADGILVLIDEDQSQSRHWEAYVINSDGSLAENCGNGLRCLAAVLWRRYAQGRDREEGTFALTLQIGTNTYTAEVFGRSQAHLTTLVNVLVRMPTPIEGSDLDWAQPMAEFVNKELAAMNSANVLMRLQCFTIGNPHLVIWYDSDRAPKGWNGSHFPRLAHAIQTRGPLAGGCNVHLAAEGQSELLKKSLVGPKQILNQVEDVLEMKIWERGAGETQACGSGACAVAASYLTEGLSERDAWLALSMPGGTVYVQQRDPDAEMSLVGPAEFVFSGEFDL